MNTVDFIYLLLGVISIHSRLYMPYCLVLYVYLTTGCYNSRLVYTLLLGVISIQYTLLLGVISIQ